MANLTDISVNDATSPTPVAHVFKPMSVGKDELVFNTVTQTTMQGRERLVITQDNRKGSRKVQVKLYLPITEAVTGPNGSDTIVKRQGYASVEVVCPVNSALKEREDLLQIITNSLSSAFLKAVVNNGEWAT